MSNVLNCEVNSNKLVKNFHTWLELLAALFISVCKFCIIFIFAAYAGFAQILHSCLINR